MQLGHEWHTGNIVDLSVAETHLQWNLLLALSRLCTLPPLVCLLVLGFRLRIRSEITSIRGLTRAAAVTAATVVVIVVVVSLLLLRLLILLLRRLLLLLRSQMVMCIHVRVGNQRVVERGQEKRLARAVDRHRVQRSHAVHEDAGRSTGEHGLLGRSGTPRRRSTTPRIGEVLEDVVGYLLGQLESTELLVERLQGSTRERLGDLAPVATELAVLVDQ
mmetsp:Transcript_26648/g.66963  ORF Transcript_26648/g.66963 Transcript_26648/m.66963 type:complete len:218 (+) Transcript_26648:201-854(+)